MKTKDIRERLEEIKQRQAPPGIKAVESEFITIIELLLKERAKTRKTLIDALTIIDEKGRAILGGSHALFDDYWTGLRLILFNLSEEVHDE